MKMKKLLGGVVFLVPGLGWAQPSVNLYGVVDMAVSSYHGQGGGTQNLLTSGGNQASRFGIRVRESLGDGLSAGAELESGLNTDTGTGQATNTNNQPSGAAGGGAVTFNRKSYLYLESQNLGQIRLGRDYTPTFWNLFLYDPFRTGVGMSAHVLHGTTSTGFRTSNSVGYFSPGCASALCKGIFFQAMMAWGENGGDGPDRDNGRVRSFRLGYGGSNWDVTVSSAVTTNAAADDYTQSNIGASYQWQQHKLMLLLGENKTGKKMATLGGGNRVRFWQLGGAISVGKGSIPVSYMRLTRNDGHGSASKKWAIGYQYPLSKRTMLYGSYAYIDNSGSLNLGVANGSLLGPTPVAGGSASGVDIGIRHTF